MIGVHSFHIFCIKLRYGKNADIKFKIPLGFGHSLFTLSSSKNLQVSGVSSLLISFHIKHPNKQKCIQLLHQHNYYKISEQFVDVILECVSRLTLVMMFIYRQQLHKIFIIDPRKNWLRFFHLKLEVALSMVT